MNKKLLKENDYEILVSESVGKGHPDKICDQISDAIVDACLKQDAESRVACEVMAANRLIVVSGEITTNAIVNVEQEVWKVIKPLGYSENDFTIICNINSQSDDIAKKVNKKNHVYGAGDQGITYGYATNETDVYLPLQFVLASELLKHIENLRSKKKIPGIKADMKSQVELYRFKNGAISVHKVILAIQHVDFNKKEVNLTQIEWKDLIAKEVINLFAKYALPINKEQIFINASGNFIIGGPVGDTGLTGRKLQVDTYGAVARHGGGALSGKDYTKVDRSGAYLARWIAKNIVFNKLADECEIGLSWEIGATCPDDLIIECFGTNKVDLNLIRQMILKNFNDLNLTKNIKALDLKKPIYFPTSVYGHFGNENFSWEKTFTFKK